MRRLLCLLLPLMLLCLPAMADVEIQPDGYTYCGYMPGGITFLIPDNMQSAQLYRSEIEAGILMYAESRVCSIQLRRFEPETMTLTRFMQLLEQEPNTQWNVSYERGTAVVCYRNLAPSSDAELVGVVITGTDGCMYKVSIFTGWDGNYAGDAPAWEIAEVVSASLRHEDFSFFQDGQ